MKNKTVAIAGCGGVGGHYAEVMARLGIQNYHIADLDFFAIDIRLDLFQSLYESGIPGITVAPWANHFDAYTLEYKQSYIMFGAKNPLQIIKRWIAKRLMSESVNK